jgi:hypothetical protein
VSGAVDVRRTVLALGLCAGAGAVGCAAYDPPNADGGGVYASCCGGEGTCVPAGLLAAELEGQLDREACERDLLCAPSAWIEGDGPVRCRVFGGVEGRCVPRCVPAVAELGALLEQANCGDGYACVPCVEPLTRAETGVCE